MDDTTNNILADTAALPSDEIKESAPKIQKDAQPQGDTAFTQPFDRVEPKITLEKEEPQPQITAQSFQPQPVRQQNAAPIYQPQPVRQQNAAPIYQPQPMQQYAPQGYQQPMQQYSPQGYQQPMQQYAPQGYQQPTQQYAPQGYQQPTQQYAPQGFQQPMQQYAPQGYQQQYAHPYGASISGYTNAYPTYPQYPVFRKTPQEAEKEALHKAASSSGGLTIAIGLTMLGVGIAIMIAAVLTGVFSSDLEGLEGNPYMGFTPMGYYLFMGISSLASCFIPAVIVMNGVKKEQKLKTEDILPFSPIGGKKLALIVFAGIGICMTAQIISTLYSLFLGLFGIDVGAAVETTPGTSLLDIVMNSVCIAIIPGLVEEFAFRGVVLGALKKYDVRIAIIGSAFLFGILHGNFAQIPFAFMLGLMFGYVRVKTNSMLPSILIHFANNFYATILMTTGELLPETATGIIDNSVMIVFTALGFVCLYLLAKDHKDFFKLDIKESCLPYSEKLSTFFSTGTVIAMIIFAAIESFGILAITL